MKLAVAMGGIWSTLHEIVAEDFREHPVQIDISAWVTAGMYLFSLSFFGVLWWKAIIFASVVFMSVKYRYGRRPLIWVGLIATFFALSVWADILPSPSEWRSLLKATVTELRG